MPLFRFLILFLAAALAAGCARLGDFDRPNASFFHDEALPVVGLFRASNRGEPVSLAPLTDDEQALRDLAYGIISPPVAKQKWFLSITDLKTSRVYPNNDPQFEVEKYADTLIGTPYRSSTARYARLVEDIRVDSVRIAPFFIVAKRVVDMDTARERSLAGVTRLSGRERETAMARIAENRMVIGWVYRRFGERSLAYRYALERLFITQPAPAAVDAERALRALDERLTKIPVLSTEVALAPPPRNGQIVKD